MTQDMKVYGKFTDMFKYTIKRTNVLRSLFLLFTLMTLGATNGWAQDDYSGVYYIANYKLEENSGYYSTSDLTKNYYLCPTEGYVFFQSPKNYSASDTGMPFLTTYKARNHADYDLRKMVWIIKKSGDYYTIRHALTGKYITYNEQIQGTSNAGRMRFHLQESDDPGDNMKFQINNPTDSRYTLCPKNSNSNSLNPAAGNKDKLTADGGSGGPTGVNVGGIVGQYGSNNEGSQWVLEKAVLFPTITIDDATGKATITSEEGTTIRYALDDDTPTIDGTSYTSPIDISGHTAIKAIAVRTSDNKVSVVATIPLKEYTYHIVNRAEDVAIQHTIKQVVGKQLSDYNDIPAAIRSPYLEGEDVTFLSNFTDFDHLDDYKITKTPSEGTDIYVVYTTTHLRGKFLHLNGARPLNLKVNGDYVYDSGTTGTGILSHTSSETDIATNPYFWFFEGEDPYAINIRNAATNNIIGYATPSSSPTSLTLNTSPANSKFIIMATSGGGEYQQMELMAATGDGSYYRTGRPDNINISTTATGDASLQIRAYPNSATITYKLIDQAGKILLNIETKSDAVELPSDWQSPLVDKYNYWKVGAFDITGDVYKLKADPESFRINNITDAEDNVIYVTYEVNDKVTFDISDDDKTHSGEYQTYMLRFYQGQYFNQENGTDGIETSPQKAEYPYSNGDAMLYVYSDTRRETQFTSGASTRPRWLWYAVSPKEAKIGETSVTPGYKGDPYHVKIMSHSADVKSKTDPDNTKHQNFFRTYLVNYGGSDHVVTGLTTKHADVTDQAPTEYMVLSAPNGRYKLVTLNEIEGAPDNGSYGKRQTVNTFEQYWKNNPTVQNRLGDAKVTVSESATDDIELTPAQASLLTGWHTYQKWAQAAPWVSWSEDGKTGKKYQNKHHWFQTIDMGATGEFTFEAATLEPEVILLDQHGWEIMRAPLSDAAALRKYDSPMVQEYQWYPTAAKVTGYHKYKVSDPKIIVYKSYVDAAGKTKWQNSGNTYTHTSTSLADNPYDHFTEHGWELQDQSVKTDFYVTYTVKPEYARLYAGAATEDAVNPSAFMVKQGNEYAKISDSNTLTPTTDNPYALASIGDEWHWYVKPNFNIDKEMGYDYDVEEDDGAGGTYTPNQAQKDAKNYEEGRNGFDPYNIQIQSVKNGNYYFKTTTTGSQLNKGAWEGSSTDLSLKNMSAGRQENVDGNDQTKLSITNATFMVIKDASGNMLLMPRFDHTKVVNSFSGEQLSAPNAATKTLELIMAPKIIHSSNEFASLNGQYTLAEDFTFESDFTSLGSSDAPFTGSIDGALHKLSGLSNLTTPLIAYADGAIIKNIILDNVTVGNAKDENKKDIPNVGAIVANATGETRIYNCGINGGSVGGTGNVGGIVGNLHGEEIKEDGKEKYIGARVINCYSYANVTSGTNVGGIVGNNDFASTASKIATMVMNCAFYGDITGGTTISPVYGGKNINNLNSGGLNTFNYYAYDNLKSTTVSTYNCALGVQDVFWNRFEQYRQLLNSNRKLAAHYASSTEATVKPSDMMKWVLETADRSIVAPNEPKPYPILKVQDKYPSIINYDAENAPDSASVGRNHGGKLGKTLRVHLSGTGITTFELTLQRMDKDFDRFNFNYDKVQLPYFNDVGTGNYTNDQVVTGWKITRMDGGTAGTFNPSDTWGGYNFADRKCTAKDIYTTSGRVFSQGAYFDVPYGVTDIYIEPYWGEAVYVADRYLDVVYNTSYGRQDVSQLPETYGADGVEVSINGSTQKVWHTIGTAVNKLSEGGTVYDHAVVLVGNVHLEGDPPTVDKSFTVMSADLDFDNEPDYSFIFGHDNRKAISPVRFDFLNMPGIAMAQKPNGATLFRNVSIFNFRGWFETTNTCIARFVQLEYDNSNLDNKPINQKSAAPVILQGGMIDQFVSTKVSTPRVTTYLHIGGNTWFKDFGNGTHSDGNAFTPHIPISVTGGDFDGFYLSGTYRPDAKVEADNAECYISGGRFKEAAGAAQQQINGDVQWQIYNADIDNFYGGGVNAGKPITGNIKVDIINSHVGTYCGGPKFGNMQSDKTVTTTGTRSTFDYFFGAGYGGISYNRVRTRDTNKDVNFASWQSDYTGKRGNYYTANSGIATDFDYEFFVWSTGTTGGRFYVKYSSLSTAQTNNVTSTLTNCIVNRDFYGGGSLGNVIGTATSTLNGCTVEGNVFGGGYSASQPKVPVRIGGFKTNKIPKIDTNAGVFDMGEMTDTEDFTLVYGTLTNNKKAINDEAKTIITDVDLTTLGQVTNTDLTIKGNTIVKGQIFDADGNVSEKTGGVYGGGDMSDVNGNTKVDIQNTDATGGVLNVFGGGNTADVIGNSQVDMTGGKVVQSVYGGGRGETTKVGGDVMVNIGGKTGEAPSISYSGTGLVEGDVYGGSALGKVNTTADKTTTVNVYGGTVNGSVFGGGLGQVGVAKVGEPGDPGYVAEIPEFVALSQGDVIVNVERGAVKTAVYGGSNVNGVLKKDATVTLIGGTIGSDWGGTPPNPLPDVVFGGGKGAPTLVNGNVTVNVGTMTPATPPAVPTYTGNATIHGHVYGGGELGNTNASKPESELVFDATKKTRVNLYAGTINGYAYGGALGSAETPAYVGGDSVIVTLDGAKVRQVFGANNINGTPKGHVLVWVKRTVDSAKPTVDGESKPIGREGRTTYDVEAVYGGGNMADYVPTDACLDPAVEGNPAKIAAATAEVLIEGCQKTSINYVYGGGNAAAVPATDVTVKGTYIINTLYGGGNGSGYMDPPTNSIPNPGANIGIYKNGETPTNYGTGKAVTKLLGGYINNVYGGSNTKGDVRGGTDVSTKKQGQKVTGDCCSDLYVGEIYGAGSHADVKGDVNITLDCLPDEFVDAVYGGAEEAVIEGNVTLTVTSGRFGRVFGGNNKGGNIQGSITVNIYEDGCKPLIIGEVYGGGNAAPYSIYGCSSSTDPETGKITWKANKEGEADLNFDQEANRRAAIQVNIIACTSVGKVFGGGMGSTAKVIGNTNVDVNLLKGIVEGVKQSTIGKVGQVFGGGGEADVIGNTLVEVGTKLANEGEDEGVNITRGTYTSSSVGTYLNPEANEFIDMPSAGIYGGGLAADVDGNTTLNIGTKDQRIGEEPSVTIAGDIFGGGLGETTHVTGNVTVNIGKDNDGTPVGFANITGDVYGGSAKGTVNSRDNSTVNTYIPDPEHSETPANCYTKVNFYGGAITGNIYGGGEGQIANPSAEPAIPAIAANVFGPVTVTMLGGSVYNVFGCNNYNGAPKSTVTVNINGGTVNFSEGEVDGREGNVYGGGNQAAYTAPDGNKDNPVVNVNNGTITRNVFGGGLGQTATVAGNPHVTIGDNAPNHKVAIKWSVYGGGSLATVDGSTYIVVNSDTIGTKDQGGAKYGNIYGGGLGTEDTSKMTEAQAIKEAGIIKGNTNITVNGGTVLHNIYGGGANGSVGTFTYDGNNVITGYTSGGVANITILGGTIGTDGHENGMIFGASRGDVGKPGEIQDKLAWVYDTHVTIGNNESANPQIKGSVYGSGENGHTYHDAAVAIHSGMVGITDVSIDGGAAYLYRGNVYGGGCGTDKYWVDANTNGVKDAGEEHYNLTAGIVVGTTTVTIDGGHVVRNVYGGGAMGSVTGGTTVNISGKSVIGADGSGGGYVYAASRGYDDMEAGFATVGSTTLNISGGTIWQSAFGGGQLGTVKGSVAVNVSGGVVKNDVYGGGALANTNTDNWNTATDNWSNTSSDTYYAEVKHLKATESSVDGYYTRSGASEPYSYSPASGLAVADTKYYKKLDGFLKVAANGTANTTTVNLTGGTIGNAYGGGLGRLAQAAVPASGTPGEPGYVPAKDAVTAVEAMVYGDISVTVNGTKFTQETARVDGKAIPVTGRVFGCNNLNGTPKGSVLVHVISTHRLDDGAHVKNQFEIQGVYGGGNMSNYEPKTYDENTEFGQHTKVLIEGCDDTSIERVYGGGNASDVPFTDVTIEGAFQIGYVFGGGNGGDKINRGTGAGWESNPGANVLPGYTNVVIHGGTIGEAFGGSDSKGNNGGTELTKDAKGSCPLVINNMYGASKEAESDYDVVLNLAGCENSVVDKVFGGSYNADVRGSITVNIFSGVYTSVFGGNDRQGTIGGNITINVEEVDDCNPVIIQNLVGGGSQADYPGVDSNGKPAKAYKGAPNPRGTTTHPDSYKDFTSGNITINVKAATRIDRIFGGCDNAAATGNTTVNINMVKGSKAGDPYTLPEGYTGNAIPNLVGGNIKDEIGTIGYVYGGGNEGDVVGNSVVNIGTEKDITFTKITDKAGNKHFPDHLTPNASGKYDVLGAHIDGDVFGGGNKGNVTGNATVNICTADYSETTGYEGVSVGKSVYGGGRAADVLGNTSVTMSGGNRTEVNGAYVYDGVYGGGLMGSVGTFTRDKTVTTASNGFDHSTHSATCLGKPTACADGTGTCTVVISGGQVGPVEVATKGMKNTGGDGPVDVGFVFGAGRGEVENPNDDKDADFHTYVDKTDVTISGGLIMASVYGGGENGRVLHDTHVTIRGGQIGCGEAPAGVPKVYTDSEWTSENPATFKECLSWDYKSPFLPHDPYAQTGDTEDAKEGTDGHTYYGSVFGGGSGYYPYKVKNMAGTVTGHEWLRSAGAVYGNTVIDITGGHILTCVYGGNETTDVGTYSNNDKGQPLVHESGGKCTINMVGGTLGVPRTDSLMKAHPVTCYLFGAGKGDQRKHFNTWTNVQETEVNVSGTARIFGSVFGGGEDGHILGNAQVNIGGTVKIDLNGDGDKDDSGETFTADSEKLKIGTTGTSYVDGNIFGGGRGFSGEALTAGSTGGNVTMNITGGTMLGSVYGGGRLASVGIDFTPPTDPLYGQLVDDDNTNTHGHITVNISGGTIGTTTEAGTAHPVGGNVFGGSMGRITKLDGTRNKLWPKMAVVKLTKVNVSGGKIMNSVYGGSEYGIVRNRATVNVLPTNNPVIHGNVFGGGYGSDEQDTTVIVAGGYASIPTMYYTFTPMIWTGCVSGDTFVNISGGTVEKNVYGGGDYASVGLMNFNSSADGSVYNYITKHESLTDGFGLSWPYKFEYIAAAPNDPADIGGGTKGGTATVNITGGKIGDASKSESGYVFGGCKGKPMERYTEAFMANVRETEVTIDAGSNTIYGAVYGGGENGHVYENTDVKIKSGTIQYSVYGGGKGIDKYHVTAEDKVLRNFLTATETTPGEFIPGDIYSITAGKVYGNTSVEMTGGHVMRNVYGGGYMASVGKGNYAGGKDDYSSVSKFIYKNVDMGPMCGYGEAIKDSLWDGKNENSKAFLSSGKAKVYIKGGIVGTAEDEYGGLPTGNVIGGSKGEPAPNVFNMPVHEYNPTFHVGNINEAEVIIGDSTTTGVGPRIYASVYGGGQDGHMRRDSKVTIYGGEIGIPYSSGDQTSLQWEHRGNVYGSGSGIGRFEFDYNGDGTINHSDPNEDGMSYLAGCVARFSEVNILGGTIHRSVYGGGSVAGTGMPKFYGQNYEPYKKGDTAEGHGPGKQSQNTVTISGGTIGQDGYGGNVFGASRGKKELMLNPNSMFATSIWSDVSITGGTIYNNVYGGGELGSVTKDTNVQLTGGEIKNNAYGGGKGIKADEGAVEANIGGNTTVELNKGKAAGDNGCIVKRIFGCNDLNGTPKGHVLVHVYGTQNSDPSKGTMSDKTALPPSYSANKASDEGYIAFMTKLITDVTKSGGLASDADVVKAARETIEGKTEATLTDLEKTAILNAAKNIDDEMSALFDVYNYDVTAVYGGGDLAPYVPTVDEENTEVIIEGCNITSIKQVYGGGNAAYAPATNVLVKSAYVIGELFGGGNGVDNYVIDGKCYENPGANVGYKQLEHYDTTTPQGAGTEISPYKSITNTDPDATTKAGRIAHYSIGTGVASTTVNGGFVHSVYGGSNKKGNIRREALLTVQQVGDCPLIIDKTYAGSKEAPIDAETNTVLDCVRQGGKFYGGSQNADILNDVHVRITNGHYAQVFGGNEKAGTITGSITIDIEENGCTPIEIDELYAGGYLAPYSVYGYSTNTREVKDEYGNVIAGLTQRIPYKKGDTGALETPSRDPQINIISATKIGKIYGGGYAAELIGSPHINVNMTTGRIRKKYADEYPKTGYEFITELDAAGNRIIPVGVIGTIFGGGNKGDIYGDTYVEIGTGEWLNFAGKRETTDAEGKVYTYNSTTNKWDWTKTVGETTTSGTVDTKPAPARNAAFVLRESTGGQVFGGGDQGYVFGNTNVNIGNGYIYDRVYGGGNEGTVGTVTTRAALPGGHTDHDGCLNGKPTAFATGTGKTTVTVSGGYVGPYSYVRSASTGTATITPMSMQETGADGVAGPDDYGYVFGAGRGELVNPATDKDIDFRTYVDSTEVIISDSALIAGGVYGGAENGRVLRNTHVNIRGGQIGLGAGQTTAYAEADFIDPTTATAEEIATKAAAMPECAHWNYGSPWLPYDEHAAANASYGPSSTTGSDGHTFYGNVFGGGSGYFAYETATEGVYEWLPSAGLVEGDTYVNISGGHILTNVYGGNEMTNVTGTAHVTMTGGTLGVPRTLAQIAAHPVTCYLFGGGKGDQRVHFNMQTNVKNVNVDITGGIIYGSVFGGGEDGHVLGNVTMNIGTAAVGTEGQDGYVAAAGPTIGTWGTSYVDGNVFGGGRGFAGDALTAGVVCGNVDMNIKGGTMLGSIYGGGRLGSIGTHLESTNHANYGKLIPDNRDENYETGAEYTYEGSTHGYVTINISGGTIGNNNEYIIPQAGNIPSGLGAYPKNWTDDNWTTWKTANNVPNTDYVYDDDLGFVRLTHTKGGNVFAGAMGRMFALDGTTPLTRWYDLGMVKSTRLTITGGTIKSNVYGGGELGWTAGKHKHSNTALTATDSLSTEILIQGGTIGTEVKEAGVTRYTFGSVYGGGYGNATEKLTDDTNPKFIAGRVVGATSVTMEDGEVKGSIFGGGEVANVGLGFYSYNSTITGGTKKGDYKKDDSGITAADIAKVSTYVDVSGGTVGIAPITVSGKLRCFGGATMGNVYGGGSGNRTIVRCGLVLGNSSVSISQAEGKTTRIYHNVYGGGSFGSVGDYEYQSDIDEEYGTEKVYGVQKMHTAGTGEATVSITGGTIGSNGHENGMVFGSSRGDIANPHTRDNYMAWVNNATVTIGTEGDGANYDSPTVKGSVYGSGENGHTFGNTVVTVNSGTVGVPFDPIVVPDPSAPADPEKATTYYGASYPFRGNVYGGGCGTDTYKENGEDKYNPEAGIVRGNTTVNINGGLIAHSVYGAGSMGSVGTITNQSDTTAVAAGGTGLARHADETNGFALSWPYEFKFAENTGKATVNINGGHIGVQLTNGNIEIKGDGDVYGSARGEAGDRYKTAHLAYVRETEVNVNFPDTCTATFANYSTDLGKWCVTGSVHGSGENGYVYGDTHVTLFKGLIGHSLYGAGKGNGTYTKSLNKIGGGGTYDAKIYSLIAGRVMGNTYVTMNDGYVGRNVYGGGNMGSVGKGNYAGGSDDYYSDGYGETLTGNLWTPSAGFNPNAPITDSNKPTTFADHFLSSGKTFVKVFGGTVGYINAADPTKSMKNDLPYGNVIGGSAGEAAPNISEMPRYLYSPAFFSGYVNETDVNIGGYKCKTEYSPYHEGDYITAAQYADVDRDDRGNWEQLEGPTILASVYGGGQEGHVRRWTHVTIGSGTIGIPYNEANRSLLQTDDINNPQWLYRGNVYGAGSGITKYAYDFNGNGKTHDVSGESEVVIYQGKKTKEEDYSTSAGSVTHFTTVDVLGGTIYRNVLGGGSLASVGPPKINQSDYAEIKNTETPSAWGQQSLNQVTIGGVIKADNSAVQVKIGEVNGVAAGYGGHVFGGSRGDESLGSDFGSSIWTKVTIKNGAIIHGDVFGGGNAGQVMKDTDVKIGE